MSSTTAHNGETQTTNYVPVLRWKKGEISALKRFLQTEASAAVTPLILIDNVIEREQNESKSVRIPKEPEKYIDYTTSEMQKVFHARTGFVDTILFDSRQTGIDALEIFFTSPFAKLSPLVPVLRLTDQLSRSKFFSGQQETGLALRLPEKSFAALTKIDAFLDRLKANESQVDLIADLECLDEDRADIEPLADLLSALMRRKTPWRSVTLLAGAYPLKPNLKSNVHIDCTRFEWNTYEKVTRVLQKRKERVPAFGDYGIINPRAKPASRSGGGGGTRPIIRYCSNTLWRIWHSSTVTKKGSVSTYFDLARNCVVNPIFMGRDFSYGDRYIDDRAMGLLSQGGNPSSYITVDTEHHLTFVAAQLRRALPAAQSRRVKELPASQSVSDDGTSFDAYWDG